MMVSWAQPRTYFKIN